MVGIRWRVKWEINASSYYGYNIHAYLYMEGKDYGREIKGNYPNAGGGEAWFPTSGYYWFDKGYGDTTINSCKVILQSTNGGTSAFDTGNDVSIAISAGYKASTISSNIDFFVGEGIHIVISDETNQAYTYVIYIDVQKEDGTMQGVKNVTTTQKDFWISTIDMADVLYGYMKNMNSTKILITMFTKINGQDIGKTLKEGIASVIDSAPKFVTDEDMVVTNKSNYTELYKQNGEQIFLSAPSSGEVSVGEVEFKNKAIFNKAVLYIAENEILGKYVEESGTYVFSFAGITMKGNVDIEVRIYDSRGNYCSKIKQLVIQNYVEPSTLRFTAKRNNNYDEIVTIDFNIKVSKIIEQTDDGEHVVNSLNLLQCQIYKNNGSECLLEQDFLTEAVWNEDGTEATVTKEIAGFERNETYKCVILFSDNIYSIISENTTKNDVAIISRGIPLLSLRKNGIGVNCIYDNSIGGDIQTTEGRVISRRTIWKNENGVAIKSNAGSEITLSNMPNLSEYIGKNIVFTVGYKLDTWKKYTFHINESNKLFYIQYIRNANGSDIWLMNFYITNTNQTDWTIGTNASLILNQNASITSEAGNNNIFLYEIEIEC